MTKDKMVFILYQLVAPLSLEVWMNNLCAQIVMRMEMRYSNYDLVFITTKYRKNVIFCIFHECSLPDKS